MGKSRSAKAAVVNYFMSLHFGLCSGPIDKLLGIYVNEKPAWEGVLSSEGVISIDRPELFGGVKKEGGLRGKAHFLPGGPSQVMPEKLAAKMGRTSATCPAYRGLTTVFFHGEPRTVNVFDPQRSFLGDGFLWSANNPVIAQTVWFKCERAPKGLDPDRAMIGPDANPAHIIFECLTDTNWGLGMPSSALDVDSFSTSAETLWVEEFGLSMRWGEQARVEDFISEILDHIQANFYIHPRTGLYTLKLIRDDYDVDGLRTITPDNAKLSGFQRKMWGEVTSEISVSWTNPENEEEETVTVQNLAAIAAQGAPIPDSRNYYGVRNAALATRLAERDLRVASAPLATCEAVLDRRNWDVVPGDVIKVTWPKYQLDGLIMRVTNVDYGKVTDAAIRVTLVEDVFSLEKPTSGGAPSTEWVRPGEPPAPMEHVQVLTLPAFFAASTDLQPGVLDLEYPEVVAMLLANQSGYDTPLYELLTEQTMPNGETVFATAGAKGTIDRSALPEALTAAATSVLPGEAAAGAITGPQVGGFVFIGEGGDADMEIALVDSWDGFDWTLARGVLDTVPRDWDADTPIWFVNPGVRMVDEKTVRAAGEEPEYKLLSRTSLGVLDADDAPVVSGTLTARPHLPLRPANVKVNGTGFGSAAIGAATNIAVTWATRNRLLEDGQVVRWGASTVAPEYAQETVVTVYDQDGDPVYEQGSLWTETGLTMPASWFARYSAVTVEVRSRREGLWSLQGHRVTITGLPANSGAALPPDPPAATQPPPPTAAPAADAFTAAGTAVTATNGTSTPALLVTGTPDNAAATGLVLRYKRYGTTDYTFHPVVDLKGGTAVRVAIAPVGALTDYTVEAAYQVGNSPLGAWRVLSPNPVTTGAFIASDVVSVAGRAADQMVSDIDEALGGFEGARADITLAAEALIRRARDNMDTETRTRQEQTAYEEHRVSVAAQFQNVDGSIATAKSEAISTAATYTNGAVATYQTTVDAQFVAVDGAISTAKSQAISTAEAYTDGAISSYDVEVEAKFTSRNIPEDVEASIAEAKSQAISTAAADAESAIAAYDVEVEAKFTARNVPEDVEASIATAKAQAISAAAADAESAISAYDVEVEAKFTARNVPEDVEASIATAKSEAISAAAADAESAIAAYDIGVQAQFEAIDLDGVASQINTAKSEAIAAAESYADGAVAAYDASVSTDAGGLAATAEESLAAVSELAGKVAARYALELDADGVITGIYAIAERGAAGTSISGIKLRTDKLIITPSDDDYDGIPFAYDADLGKLVLQDVVAKSANIDALAVKTLHIDGKQVTTDKISDNAITQSVSAYTATGITLTAGVEVAIQYVSISTEDDSRVKITAAALISATGSPSYTSALKIYRRPSGGSWSLLYSIPGPQPFITGISLTKQTSFTSNPTVVDDVVMGLTNAPTTINGSSFNLNGNVTITGSGSLSGASVSLSGTTGNTTAGGDSHNHTLSGSYSVTGGSISGSAYTGGFLGASIGGSVSVPTVTAQMGKPTLALSWPFSSLVNDVTWTSAVYGIVPAFLVDMPGEGDWEYEIRFTSSTAGQALNRFLEAEEIKK